MIDSDVNAFLEHFGIRGMKWGQRKQVNNTNDKSNRNRKIILITGGVAAAIGAAVTISILRKNGKKMVPKPSSAAKQTVKKVWDGDSTKWGDRTVFLSRMLDLDNRTKDAPRHIVDALRNDAPQSYRALVDWEKSIGRTF